MRIAMWSGPRNLSTAMMYSFAARDDFAVMDEPFYAAYLAASGADHPMRDEILDAHETDPEKVALACLQPGAPHLYMKHMPHHMTGPVALAAFTSHRHTFLIRDPDRVVLAYTPDSEWRNRATFLKGREEIRAFLAHKWSDEIDYRLKKRLWAFTENRIAVRFEYEWHDHAGQWFRSHGNEMWEFDETGLMHQRFASINDEPIDETDRRLK